MPHVAKTARGQNSAALGAALAAALVTGCPGGDADGRYVRQAQDDFARTYSCPRERVTATLRKDLRAYDLQVGPQSPPREVAADPGRLAQWKKNEAEVAEGYASMRVVLTRGCGHEVYDVCSLATGTNDQQVIACSAASHPPR